MSTKSPRRTPSVSLAKAEHFSMEPLCEVLTKKVDELLDQRTALIAAGEKMELALIQSRVNRHILNDWETVIHAIEEESR